jgi:dienelactone hydrolase
MRALPLRNLLFAFAPVLGLCQAPAFTPPEDLNHRRVNIFSEGTRMSGELYSPKSASGKLPAIVMAHGWGGTAAALRRDAVLFAKAGYLVLAFDYRGWGESDSRVILLAPEPMVHPKGRFTAEVREVREVVEPIDMAIDWFNAIHWLQDEPSFDGKNLGLWGSSFSGGLVVYVAERDHRVKAIHSQVGAMDGRTVVTDDAGRKKVYAESTAMARGQMGLPEPGVKAIGNLRGAPVYSQFVIYEPVEDVNKALVQNCAMQFLIAEKEELFDNRDHAIKAHAMYKGPKNLVMVPGITHYGIYGAAFNQAHELAQKWFDKYLKQ